MGGVCLSAAYLFAAVNNMALATEAWDTAAVLQWAAAQDKLGKPVVEALRAGDVDGESLLELTSEEIRDELKLTIGKRKALERAIAALKEVAAGQLTTGPYSVINKTILSASWGSPLCGGQGTLGNLYNRMAAGQSDSLQAYF